MSIGDLGEVAVSVRTQARAAQQTGLPFDHQLWGDGSSQDTCNALLQTMNEAPPKIWMSFGNALSRRI